MIRLGALGDVVRTLPAVSALREGYPRARITWLVESPAAEVVRGQPWLDEVLVFPRQELAADLRGLRLRRLALGLWRFVGRLRRRRFDLCVDFHGILKSGILGVLCGAPVRAGYARPVAREGAWLFANRRARLPRGPSSRYQRNAALVHFLCLAMPDATPRFALDPAAVARLRDRLPGADRLALVHPGTSPATPHKRYSPRAYAAVARALRESCGVRTLVSFGCDEERRLAEAVVAASAGAAELAPATPCVADLAALFARCAVFVGSDSGPLHLATLVGTPVVQILGPTHPVENAPHPGTPSRSIRVARACSPCRRGCAEAPCMSDVSPERVAAAAAELLSAAADAGRPALVAV